MTGFLCNLARDPFGKLLIGLAAAALFSIVFWYFVPVSQASKVIFGLALLAGAYKFYNAKAPGSCSDRDR